jgi:hypothetical protein
VAERDEPSATAKKPFQLQWLGEMIHSPKTKLFQLAWRGGMKLEWLGWTSQVPQPRSDSSCGGWGDKPQPQKQAIQAGVTGTDELEWWGGLGGVAGRDKPSATAKKPFQLRFVCLQKDGKVTHTRKVKAETGVTHQLPL